GRPSSHTWAEDSRGQTRLRLPAAAQEIARCRHASRGRDDSMRLVNLTPHPVTLLVGDRTLTIPPEPTPARCSETRTVVGAVEVDGLEVPVTVVGFGEVQGLPDPQEGVLYVVS